MVTGDLPDVPDTLNEIQRNELAEMEAVIEAVRKAAEKLQKRLKEAIATSHKSQV